VPKCHRPDATDIVQVSMTGFDLGRPNESVGRVVRIGQVAELCAAPDLKRPALEGMAKPDTQEILPRVSDAHTRAITVWEAQRHHG
jgi:hypothetical protein